jgi:hypothetical protein
MLKRRPILPEPVRRTSQSALRYPLALLQPWGGIGSTGPRPHPRHGRGSWGADYVGRQVLRGRTGLPERAQRA